MRNEVKHLLVWVGLLAGLWILGQWVSVLFPLILAVFLALAMEAPVQMLTRRGINRGIAAFITLAILLGGGGLALVLGLAQLAGELYSLSRYLAHTPGQLQLLLDRVRELLGPLPGQWDLFIDQILRGMMESWRGLAHEGLHILWGILASTPAWVFSWIMAALISFFICRDRELLARALHAYLPPSWEERLRSFQRAVGQGALAFISAQMILMTLSAVVGIIGFGLMGLEYALILGIALGIVDLIPFLGPSSMLIPWSLWSFFHGGHSLGVQLLVLWGILLILRQLAEAKIISARVGIHPLAVLLSLYFSVRVFGFLGVLIGPLVVIGIKGAMVSGIWPSPRR